MSKSSGLHTVNAAQFVVAVNMGSEKVRKEFSTKGWTDPEKKWTTGTSSLNSMQ